MKIAPKGTPDWNKYEHCVLAVSLESRNHVGAALQSIVEFINQSDYKTCTIDLSDTLYRYTYMQTGLTEEAASNKALQAGNIWLTQEQKTLAQIKIPTIVKRWDEWRQHPQYASYRQQFETAFREYLPFRQAIMKDVQGFFERRKRNNPLPETSENIRLSTAYLLEELTCHSIMHETLPKSANMYPGRELKCYELVRAGLVPNVPAGLQNSYFVRLNIWEGDAGSNIINNDHFSRRSS